MYCKATQSEEGGREGEREIATEREREMRLYMLMLIHTLHVYILADVFNLILVQSDEWRCHFSFLLFLPR